MHKEPPGGLLFGSDWRKVDDYGLKAESPARIGQNRSKRCLGLVCGPLQTTLARLYARCLVAVRNAGSDLITVCWLVGLRFLASKNDETGQRTAFNVPRSAPASMLRPLSSAVDAVRV